MASSKKTVMGAFRYDLFPHFNVFDIVGLTADGVECKDFTMNISSLIATMDNKRGLKLAEACDSAKAIYREEERKLRNRLLKQLTEDFPEMANYLNEKIR